MESLEGQYGHDDRLFISETHEFLHCVVCSLVLRDPIQILSCGHKFCSICFERIKAYSVTTNTSLLCPIDRDVVDLNDVRADVAVRRLVGNLLVKCPQHEHGCEWTGELSELKHHTIRCQYEVQVQLDDKAASALVKNLNDRLSVKDKEIALLKNEQQHLKFELQNLKQQQQHQQEKQEQLQLEQQQQQQETNLLKERNIVLERELRQLKEDFKQHMLQNKEMSTSPVADVASNSTKMKSSSAKKQPMHTKTKKSVLVQHHCGVPTDVVISNDDHCVRFNNFVTVSALTAVVPPRSRVWYEVECTGTGGFVIVGWATTNFPTSQGNVNEYVGSKAHSYGFNPFHALKYHRTQQQWGKKFTGEGGFVGVALDLVRGEVLYSVNGQWTAPMGVVFTDLPTDSKLFPAFTGRQSSLKFNFGDRGFRYGPPDATFVKLLDGV